MTQRRPKGDLYIATVDYKQRVLDELVAKKWSRADFARAIGVTTAAVSQFFGPEGSSLKKSQTRLMPKINKAFKWPLPEKPTAPISEDTPIDELRARLLAAWGDIDENDRQILEAIANRAAKR